LAGGQGLVQSSKFKVQSSKFIVVFGVGKITSNDIVFLGDSLTEGFDLQHYFHLTNLKNRGISGDTTYQVLYRLEEIWNSRPAKLFLMIGINDMFQGEDESVILYNISLIISEMQKHSPGTELFIQSILPVNLSVMFADEFIDLSIFSFNDNIKLRCKELKVQFIDLYADFLDNAGELDRKYTYDGVHLSKAGYNLWARLVEPLIH
jgi:lysophospholipase L1-like esterase